MEFLEVCTPVGRSTGGPYPSKQQGSQREFSDPAQRLDTWPWACFFTMPQAIQIILSGKGDRTPELSTNTDENAILNDSSRQNNKTVNSSTDDIK